MATTMDHTGIMCASTLTEIDSGSRMGYPSSRAFQEIKPGLTSSVWTEQGIGKLRVFVGRPHRGCSRPPPQPAGQHHRGQQRRAQAEDQQAHLAQLTGQMLFFNQDVGDPPSQRAEYK